MNTSNNTLNELHAKLVIEQDLLNEAQEAVENFEYNPSDDEYDAWLDELHGDVTLGYSTWSASEVIKTMSPTDYRVGRTDFIDSVDIEDLDAYKELVQERDNLQAEVASLLEQIADLESELESE